jgi:flagellar protein FliS
MNSYSNQQNAYRKASVNTLDQNKLIVMLYDGAIKQSGFALEHIKKNDIEKAHNALVKAKNIVAELMSSLNMEKGGEVAVNLKSLYAFMFSQLIEANMNKESKPVVTVIGLLKELREAWVHIGNTGRQPQVPRSEPQQGDINDKRVNLKG